MNNEEIVDGPKQPIERPESEFFEIDETVTYRSIEGIVIDYHANDFDYPVSISAETADGRTIGLVLTREDLRRLAMEAWYTRAI